MENITVSPAKLKTKSLYEKMFLSLLQNFTKGKLKLTLADKTQIQIGNGDGIECDITIVNDIFYKKCVLYGDVGFGESYCDGDWKTSDLAKVIRWVIQNVETSGVMSGSSAKSMIYNLLGKLNRITHILNKNNKSNAVSNVSHHYDLSNEFYQMMLDQTMSYSCGIFHSKETTLEQAQLNKLERICEDLDIVDGDHILEIGCGWGGFAKYATTHFNCKVTGITISKEQYEYAKDLIQREGLEDRVEILFKDYRDLTGEYDKIVSIEMIEQVGDEYLPEYFKKIDELLKPGGAAVIQAITSPDSRYEEFKTGVDFIQKHIFPGTLLPSISRMLECCKEQGRLQLYNLRDIGPHYAKTLRLWDIAVSENQEKIKKLGMDDYFFRKWHYYLKYCEAAFRERNISDVQLTLVKPNNTNYCAFEWEIIDS